MLKQISEGLLWMSALDVCFGDPSLTLRMTGKAVLRMTKEVLRMTGELVRTRRSVMLNEVKHLSVEDPSLALRMTENAAQDDKGGLTDRKGGQKDGMIVRMAKAYQG